MPLWFLCSERAAWVQCSRWNYLTGNVPLARLNLMSPPTVQVEEEDRKVFPPGCGLLRNSSNLPHNVIVSMVSYEYQGWCCWVSLKASAQAKMKRTSAGGKTARIALLRPLDPLLLRPRMGWLKRLQHLVLGWQNCLLTSCILFMCSRTANCLLKGAVWFAWWEDTVWMFENLISSCVGQRKEKGGCVNGKGVWLQLFSLWQALFLDVSAVSLAGSWPEAQGKGTRTKLLRPAFCFPPLGPQSWMSYFSGQDLVSLSEHGSVRLGEGGGRWREDIHMHEIGHDWAHADLTSLMLNVWVNCDHLLPSASKLCQCCTWKGVFNTRLPISV